MCEFSDGKYLDTFHLMPRRQSCTIINASLQLTVVIRMYNITNKYVNVSMLKCLVY